MIVDRLAEKCSYVPIAGCYIWTGYSTSDGYGRMRVNGRMSMTHRIAYELAHGPIPAGMMVCHKCDVRSCCNPHHLFLGGNRENMADMVIKGRQSKGALRPSAKLSAEQVFEIRRRSKDGETIRSLAVIFGIGKSTVHQIVRDERWRR